MEAWNQVQKLLEDPDLKAALADGARLGRLESLEGLTPYDPSMQRGQLAFIKTGWHYRRLLRGLGWERDIIENQEVFRLTASGDRPAINLVYFTGRISDDQTVIESNPRGKRTRIGIRGNQLQYEFDVEGFYEEPSPSELWFFVVSTWRVDYKDGNWFGRLYAWLAFCDGALTYSGEPHPLGDESKFSRMRCLDYRELLNHQFGDEILLEGPPPVKVTPSVLEIIEEEE